MPNPAEEAVLIVKDQEFFDWESVRVTHRWKEGWPLFSFTASERDNLPTAWTDLQFKPGDPCTITLGGELALTGIITERQTAYDANNHTVQLSGVGKSWAASTSSLYHKDSNFDGKNLTQIANEVFEPYNVGVKVIGTVDDTPFDRISAHPGELCWDFIDRLARMRSTSLGSDHLGNMLLIGQHAYPVVQQLQEGYNILKMQCVISNQMQNTMLAVDAQKAVEDGTPPSESNEMEATANGTMKSVFKFLRLVTEQPVKTQQELEARANYENIQREGTLIEAHVTVQGWLRDGANLWRCGDDVWVISPMAMLNMAMKIQSATFTQDNNSGTTTTLELVLPWLLNDKVYATGPLDVPPPAPADNSDPLNPPSNPLSQHH
jgi:prophage tail gpP-like protein